MKSKCTEACFFGKANLLTSNPWQNTWLAPQTGPSNYAHKNRVCC